LGISFGDTHRAIDVFAGHYSPAQTAGEWSSTVSLPPLTMPIASGSFIP
jgi:hypothetical protein